MMPLPHSHLETLTEALRQLYPVHGLVHVGVGRGQGFAQQWASWQPARAWLFEPDEERLAAAQIRLGQPAGWEWQRTVIAAQSEERLFFEASLPLASGLIEPTALQRIWPNLQVTAQQSYRTQSLDSLIPAHEVNWLVIECLPALSILQGAEALLKQCSVVRLQLLLRDLAENLQVAYLTAIQAFLEQRGFVLVGFAEDIHPAIGEAIFCRPLIAEYNQQNQVLIEVQQQRTVERDQQAQALTEAQQQLQQRTAERDAQTKTVTEAQQIQQKLDQVTRERDELKKQLQQQQEQVQRSESENREAQARQQLMHEEMLKAEAQIELIKDLLLRGESL